MDSLIKFNNCSEPTIGVEVELQIVDKDSMDLYPGAPQILDKFKEPTHRSTVIITKPIDTSYETI